MPLLFFRLRETVIACFRGWSLVTQLIACVLTYLIVVSGMDWYYFLATRQPTLQKFFFPAIILGGIIPILFPLAVLLVGYLKKNKRLMAIAWAMGQAVLLGFLISSTYKVFTGRLQPDLIHTTIDISRQFRFGFFRGGAFWGWPSSHTTIAFAMMVVWGRLRHHGRVAFLPKWYALYIGLGVSISIHWFSEFIAGALIGSVIGYQVANRFEKYLQETHP